MASHAEEDRHPLSRHPYQLCRQPWASLDPGQPSDQTLPARAGDHSDSPATVGEAALASHFGPSSDHGAVSIPKHFARIDQHVVISRIEELVERLVDALNDKRKLELCYQPPSNTAGDTAERTLSFPSAFETDTIKFTGLLRILSLAYQHVISGELIAKRDIYYKNQDLFKSQQVSDTLIDNAARTLGLGREALNIVATKKGLMSGHIMLTMLDGSKRTVSGLLPSIWSVDKIDFGATTWMLIIEKDATYMTLAESGYACTSPAGHGILVTGKGQADLLTRNFVSVIHTIRPQLKVFALVDFDPYGIRIMQTYKYGSRDLNHEKHVTVPGLKWLGIKSSDILANRTAPQPLTPRDRKAALDTMKAIHLSEDIDTEQAEQAQELRMMLMLGVKAEIQAVEDVQGWLDSKLVKE